jgi:hypothetical protein
LISSSFFLVGSATIARSSALSENVGDQQKEADFTDNHSGKLGIMIGPPNTYSFTPSSMLMVPTAYYDDQGHIWDLGTYHLTWLRQ